MSELSLYQLLGVEPSADTSDLRQALERTSGDSPPVRIRTALAVDALADPNWREDYDAAHHIPVAPTPKPAVPVEVPPPHVLLSAANRLGDLLAGVPGLLAGGLVSVVISFFLLLGGYLLSTRVLPSPSPLPLASFWLAWLVAGATLLPQLSRRLVGAAREVRLVAVLAFPTAGLTLGRPIWVMTIALTGAMVVFAALTFVERHLSVKVTPRAASTWPHSTRFGAALDTPARSASVLRALALSSDATLAPASDLDLVASVIAADAWMLALGADHLDQGASYGSVALGSLGAALARAAGAPAATAILPGAQATDSDVPGLTQYVEEYRAWASKHLGERASLALELAAQDLAWGGGSDDILAAVARTLHAA